MYTQGVWAHRQGVSTTFLTREKTLTKFEGGNEEKLHYLQVSILIRACTHGGWAHRQRVSTTCLTIKTQILKVDREAELPSRTLRSSSDTLLCKVLRATLSSTGQRAFAYTGPTSWNSLLSSLHQTAAPDSFRRNLKTFLFTNRFSVKQPDSYACLLFVIRACTLFLYLKNTQKTSSFPLAPPPLFPRLPSEVGVRLPIWRGD